MLNFVQKGDTRGKGFLSRVCAQKLVPPGACRPRHAKKDSAVKKEKSRRCLYENSTGVERVSSLSAARRLPGMGGGTVGCRSRRRLVRAVPASRVWGTLFQKEVNPLCEEVFSPPRLHPKYTANLWQLFVDFLNSLKTSREGLPQASPSGSYGFKVMVPYAKRFIYSTSFPGSTIFPKSP